MHHPRARDLEPAGVLADPAAFAAAEDTVHVHLDARLGEGKVTGPEAHLAVSAKHAPGVLGHHAL